jgi:hypothetical protein
MFGPKRDEVTGELRRLYKEELGVPYCSPNIIWVIKSRRMRWAAHVACVGRGEVHTGFWWRNLGGKHLQDLVVDGRVILK